MADIKCPICLTDAELNNSKDFGRKNEGLLVITKKPVGSTLSEESNNPKSRSARLRVFEKL